MVAGGGGGGCGAPGASCADTGTSRSSGGIDLLDEQQSDIHYMEHAMGEAERPDTYQANGSLDKRDH